MKTSTKRSMIIGAVVVLAIVAIILAFTLTGPKEIVYKGTGFNNETTLESMIKNGKVESVYIEGGYKVNVQLTGSNSYEYYAYIPSRADLAEDLEQWQEGKESTIKVVYNDPSSTANLSSFIVPILMIVCLGGLFLFIMRKSAGANNKALEFGKTNAQKVKDSKVRFVDVAGAEEEKQELQEIVEFLKNPKKFKLQVISKIFNSNLLEKKKRQDKCGSTAMQIHSRE